MLKQTILPLLTCTTLLLFSGSVLNAAAYDHGTKGVSDTTRVKDILQITDDTDTSELKMLSGWDNPHGDIPNVVPWSRDGEWITFTARFGGTGNNYSEICRIKADGTGFERLTNDTTGNEASDSNASFGGDGRIYYTHNGTSGNETWRMDANGNNKTNLSTTHSAGAENWFRVSPNGQKIAYTKSVSNQPLYVSYSSGSSEVKVSGKRADNSTDLYLYYGSFSWSADSQYLAFSANDGDGRWIYVVKSDGSEANSINASITKPNPAPANTEHWWPEFSPDGKKIAYVEEASGTYTLKLVDPDGSNPKVLDTAIDSAADWIELRGPFTWSPDSKWLAYRKNYKTGTTKEEVALFMVDVTQATPAPVQLTKDYNDYIPAWSPLGSQLLFQSRGGNTSDYPTRENQNNGDTGDLLLMNLIGDYSTITHDWGTTGVADTDKVKNILQITGNGDAETIPSTDNPGSLERSTRPWSKDGEWIVYTRTFSANSSVEDKQEVCIIKPDGTGFKKLTTNSVPDSNATFGSDNKVYFERDVGSYEYKIFRINTDGSNEENLTDADTETTSGQHVLPSPDAAKIAFRSDSRLWVANSDGTNQHQVSMENPTLISLNNGYYSWSPDSDWLAYSGYTSYPKIYMVKADGSSHKQLVSSPEQESETWPAWSPVGNKIAYTSYYYNGSYSEYYLKVANSDGSNPIILDQGDDSGNNDWRYIYGPLSWSPDGKWVAYRKNFNDGQGTYYHSLFIVNVHTKKTYQLTTGYYDYSPFWSPDGSRLLFSDSTSTSRDDDDALGVGTNNSADLLLINLLGDYAGGFPWHMFLPAIQGGSK